MTTRITDMLRPVLDELKAKIEEAWRQVKQRAISEVEEAKARQQMSELTSVCLVLLCQDLRFQLTQVREAVQDALTKGVQARRSALEQALESVKFHAEKSAARVEEIATAKNLKLPIATDARQFDLVRYMRSQLHEAELISDEEYAWLCSEAPLATAPEGGSPSPRRLESYDDMRKRIAELEAQLKEAKGGG